MISDHLVGQGHAAAGTGLPRRKGPANVWEVERGGWWVRETPVEPTAMQCEAWNAAVAANGIGGAARALGIHYATAYKRVRDYAYATGETPPFPINDRGQERPERAPVAISGPDPAKATTWRPVERVATTVPAPVIEPAPAPQPKEEPVTPAAATADNQPTEHQRIVWDTVQRLGTQTAAARHLAISQGAVQNALSGYMKHMGIEGPLPGKLTDQPGTSPAAEAPADDATEAQSEPIGEVENAGAASARDGDEIDPATIEELVPARWFPTSTERIVSAPLEPADRLLESTSPSSLDDLPPIVWGSLHWLAEHGHEWTQEQAEKWLRSFTAAVDLAYPPAYAP